MMYSCTQCTHAQDRIIQNLPKEYHKREENMERRNFLVTGSLIGLSPYMYAQILPQDHHLFQTVEKTIAAVQEHMFPSGGKLPSAKEMHATRFLYETIMYPAYDRDIRAFVIEGAKELQHREKHRFADYSPKEKEEALRAYEKSSYGSNWLSRIMILTMEALFSDPVYGSNIHEAGWKALHSIGGEPRPKTRYIT